MAPLPLKLAVSLQLPPQSLLSKHSPLPEVTELQVVLICFPSQNPLVRLQLQAILRLRAGKWSLNSGSPAPSLPCPLLKALSTVVPGSSPRRLTHFSIPVFPGKQLVYAFCGEMPPSHQDTVAWGIPLPVACALTAPALDQLCLDLAPP